MGTKKRNSYLCYIFGAAFLLILDQWTKYLASVYLKDGSSIILIRDVFQLHYLENRGAAFGLLQGRKLWFVAITVIMLAMMLMVYYRIPLEKKYRWMRVILALLTAGAMGNLIDRLRLNYVIDFFYFELINFPIFNVADIYVVVSSICLFIYVCFVYQEEDFSFMQRKKG